MRKQHTVLELIELAAGYLAGRGIDSARLDAEVLLGHTLGLDRVGLYVNFDRPLETHEVDAYRRVIAERGQRKPVAQITGVREFYSYELTVTPDVLIPRPETELLVETVLAYVKHLQARRPGHVPRIVDVGTGSGAIAVVLAAELPEADVWAIDCSPDALRVAQQNAARLGVSDRVTFRQGQWLQPVATEKPFDVVVSNPPYIPSAQIEQLMPEVRLFEPRLALDGGVDGLDSYRELLPAARHVVGPGGMVAVEVGDGQAEQVAAIGRKAGWSKYVVHNDLAGKGRVVAFTQAAATPRARSEAS